MAEQFDSLSEALVQFIEQQPVFFVATAAPEGRVNLSPKGQQSLKVLAPNQILWENFTGSGNETAAHLLQCQRMTLMWCAFSGPPMILRAYGQAQAIHPRDAEWQQCTTTLPPSMGTRQYFRVNLDLVQTSCGYAVPLMSYQQDRVALDKWADKKGPEGIEAYWQEKNQLSIDGKPTGIFS